MYWWKELLFVSSYKVCFQFQNFVSCSVSYNINWIVTQIGFFPGPHICSKALTGVGRGITSPFHGDFYFNFHLSWLMCKSWMLQRLEKLICLVRSFSMSCDIFDLHICQDRWKLENWCLLLTQVDCLGALSVRLRNLMWTFVSSSSLEPGPGSVANHTVYTRLCFAGCCVATLHRQAADILIAVTSLLEL